MIDEKKNEVIETEEIITCEEPIQVEQPKSKNNNFDQPLEKREQSLWKKGKDDNNKFLKLKFSRKVNVFSFLMGILFTAIIIIPFACLTFEFIELYWYDYHTKYLFLAIAWGLIMVCNGLSNYITIRVVKSWNEEMTDLQKIDEKAVFFYQCLNPGFAIFILAILIFFGMSS